MTYKDSLEAKVRAYAFDHYNDSFIWSVIVEAKTSDELADELAAADITTLAAALAHFGVVGEIFDDRLAEAAQYEDRI